MTQWEWTVVVALVKVVTQMLQYGTANAKISFNDVQLLEEVLEREKNK